MIKNDCNLVFRQMYVKDGRMNWLYVCWLRLFWIAPITVCDFLACVKWSLCTWLQFFLFSSCLYKPANRKEYHNILIQHGRPGRYCTKQKGASVLMYVDLTHTHTHTYRKTTNENKKRKNGSEALWACWYTKLITDLT